MLQESPNVHHVFNGGLAVQNSTADCRTKILELLVILQNDVQQLAGEGVHVEVTADVKIKIAQREAAENSYQVRVNTAPQQGEDENQIATGISADNASSGFLTAREDSSDLDGSIADLSDLEPTIGHRQTFKHESPSAAATTMTPTMPSHNQPDASGSSAAQQDYRRPSKRRRTDEDRTDMTVKSSQMARSRTGSMAHPRTEVSPRVSHRPSSASHASTVQSSTAPPSGEVMMSFLEGWRTQWHSQGGWMYDHLTKLSTESQQRNSSVTGKLSSISTAIPAVGNQILAEINNMTTNVIPWLERCRKTDVDASRAREEKWRTSSAAFHDQARRERETAEVSILSEIKSQRSVLNKQMKMMKTLLKSQGLAEYEQGDDENL